MPTYEFRCPEGHDFEKFFRKISDAVAELPCPRCGAIAARRISAGAGLVFKGSGFYITDYGKDGKGARKPAESSGAGEGSGGEGGKPEGGAKGGEAGKPPSGSGSDAGGTKEKSGSGDGTSSKQAPGSSGGSEGSRSSSKSSGPSGGPGSGSPGAGGS